MGGSAAFRRPALTACRLEWACGTAARHRCEITLTRCTAFGYYHDNFVGLWSGSPIISPISANGPREKMWHMRAGEVVLAQGAIERPLVFRRQRHARLMLAPRRARTCQCAMASRQDARSADGDP
jgi:hypothetical protein